MDLRLTAEQQQLRDATRRLLTERLDTLIKRLPEPPAHDLPQTLRDAQALGWLGLGLPEDVGGVGSFEDLIIVHEELGRGLAPSLLTTLTVAARLTLHSDPGPARDDLLGQLCAGTALVAPALGDGTTVEGRHLEGQQRHVVDARAASAFLVAARASASGLVKLMLVQADAAGVRLGDEPGMADVPQCELTLTGVTLDVDTCLAADARSALRAVRAESTALAAARAVGGGRAVLERTVEHVRTRHQFDRPIGTFQAVQHQLADVAIALDAAGLAVARAAWSIASSSGLDDIDNAAALAGFAAREAFTHATLVAHQLHGGMGFVLDSPLHLWSARAVADPTGSTARRHLLDLFATSSGLTANTVRLPEQHRA